MNQDREPQAHPEPDLEATGNPSPTEQPNLQQLNLEQPHYRPGLLPLSRTATPESVRQPALGMPPTPPVSISEEDQRWSLIAHYGASALLVLTLGTVGWLAGLVTLFLKGNSPVVRAHAVESTNFQLTWGVFTIVGVALGVLTSWTCFSVLFALSALISGGFAFVFSIIGGYHASRGALYRYPVSFRIIQ